MPGQDDHNGLIAVGLNQYGYKLCWAHTYTSAESNIDELLDALKYISETGCSGPLGTKSVNCTVVSELRTIGLGVPRPRFRFVA